MLRSVPALLFLGALLVVPVEADVLHLKDGRSFDGEIVSANDQEVRIRIKSPAGEAVLACPRDQILAWDKTARTAYEALLLDYRQRLAAAEATTGLEVWEDLARWADRNRLRDEARLAWRKVLAGRLSEVDSAETAYSLYRRADYVGLGDLAAAALEIGLELGPEHTRIREALGHKRFQGQWLTPEAYLQALAAQREAERQAREAEEREAEQQRLAERVAEAERKVAELSRKRQDPTRQPTILILSDPREYSTYRSNRYFYGYYRYGDCGSGYYYPGGGSYYGGYRGVYTSPRVLGGTLRVRLGR